MIITHTYIIQKKLLSKYIDFSKNIVFTKLLSTLFNVWAQSVRDSKFIQNIIKIYSTSNKLNLTNNYSNNNNKNNTNNYYHNINPIQTQINNKSKRFSYTQRQYSKKYQDIIF